MTEKQIEKKKKMYMEEKAEAVKRIREFMDAPWLAAIPQGSAFHIGYIRPVMHELIDESRRVGTALSTCINAYLKLKLDKNTYKELVADENAVYDFVHHDLLADKVCEEVNLQWIESLRDSGPVEFDGDIIITDPCYFVEDDYDWDDVCDEKGLSCIGFSTSMTRDTIFGDWSCTAVDTDTGEDIGYFCADAGMVSVALLDDVLSYNPRFSYHITRPDLVTVIHDFKGTVQFIVREYTFDFEGRTVADHRLEIVGHGVNKKTGKDINFVGTMFFEDEDEVNWVDWGDDD